LLDNYQAVVAEQPKSPAVQNFATVGAVYDDGLSLIFDGTSESTAKHYRCNASIKFAAGDRVRILADSGTYIVEYVVGVPLTTIAADTAKLADSAKQIVGNEGNTIVLSANVTKGHFYIWADGLGGWKQIDN